MLHAWTEHCLIISNQIFLIKTPTMHPSIQLPLSVMESVINKHLHFRKEWLFLFVEYPLILSYFYFTEGHVLFYTFFPWHLRFIFFFVGDRKIEILYIFVGQLHQAASQFLSQYQQRIYSSKERKCWRDRGLWEGGFVWFCCLNLQSCFWRVCHRTHKGRVEFKASSALRDL